MASKRPISARVRTRDDVETGDATSAVGAPFFWSSSLTPWQVATSIP
jgi:hypothetical protein